MNPVIKQLWVDALRSGEYKQGINFLTRKTDSGDEDCCLGVLCKLSNVPSSVSIFDTDIVRYDGETQVLPSSVINWAGIDFEETGLPFDIKNNERQRPFLTYLNDAGFTFDQIADLIDYFL